MNDLIDDLITPAYVNELARAARRIARCVEELEALCWDLADDVARQMRTQHARLARLNRAAYDHVSDARPTLRLAA
jgi:hypothetical protein